jgi:uncharacterized integral membrane protein (TIGR00698 family)
VFPPSASTCTLLPENRMSAETTADAANGPTTPPWRRVTSIAPGVLLAVTVGLASAFVSGQYGGPVMLYALLLGMAFNHLSEDGAGVSGIEFASRTILRVGVALLGARITLEQMYGLGGATVALILGGLVATIVFGWCLARVLGLRSDFGILTGGAVGICGASAALALSAVLPRHEGSEQQTLVTVVGVTALSTIAMVVYPMLASLIGLDTAHTGVFFGGTIHDVAQVVGAGYMVSPETGDTSTIVKLTRVAMLAPVALAVSLLFRRRGNANARTPALPAFLVAFVVLVLVNSTGVVSKTVSTACSDLSRACLVTSIAALGVKTSFKKLATVGWRPIALMVAETVFLAVVVLTALSV